MEAFSRIIRGWLGMTLLVLIGIVLVATSMVGYFEHKNDPNVAKTVNGQTIATKEVDDLVKRYQEQYLPSVNGDQTRLNTAFIRETTLDSLVGRSVLSQQSEKLGIALADAQLEKMIAQQPSFQQNGKFSNALYENYLRSVGMTNQDLLTSLRQDHALKMLVTSLTSTALVSQLNVQQIAQLQSEQRHLHLASIQLNSFKAGQSASAAEIQAYYNQNKAQFNQTAKVDVDYVLLTPVQVLTSATAPTEAELKQAYAAYVKKQTAATPREVKHVLITLDNRSDAAAKALANEVYAKIQAGMSFAQAAKSYSDDSSSKNTGGVIAGYQVGAFSKDFDAAIAALVPGQVSKPVKTQYGYHIIEASPSQVKVGSFEQEKPRLIAEVQKNKADTAYSDTVNRLNDAVVSNDALQVVTQAVPATRVQSLNAVGLDTEHPYLSDSNVKARIFGDDVKNGDRNVSSSIQLKNGDTIWIKVRQYHAAGIPSLARVYAQVKAKVIEQKAYVAAKRSIQNMLNDFKTLPAEQVRAKYRYNFEDAGTFTRAQGLKPEIERTAFSLTAPKSAGYWSVGTAQLPNELIVVAVSEVKNDAVGTAPEQTKQLAQLYQQMRGQQELEDYTDYLKSKAKIK